VAALKKELTFRVMLLITINSILGTGIFFLPAIGAQHSGPASLISWGIMGMIAIYMGMCFAELSSMFPKAGGIYEYCKQAFGRFPSFLVGWTTIIAGNITIAMLVVGAIQYIFPPKILYITIPLALLFVFVFNFIAFRGLKTSAFMLVTFSLITLVALFSLIIPGLMKLQPSYFKPFFVFPISSIFLTIFFIAETFFGWETATFLAEETKDGQKVMPKVLITATVIIVIISFLVVITSLGVIPWEKFAQSRTPLADLSVLHFGAIGEKLMTMMVYLAIIGAVAGWIVSAPRLLLAMARDELFPKQLAAIHPKYNTPYKAIIFQVVLTTILVFIGAGSYESILHMLLPIVLLLYSAVLIAMVVLRYTKKDVKRYYTAPFGVVLPILTVLFLLSLIVAWWIEQPGAMRMTFMGASLIFLGIPIYFLLEMFYDAKFIRRAEDAMARFSLWFERVNLPVKREKEILQKMGNLKGKTVYEYECGVGTLTKQLSRLVGPKGKVYATDVSEKHVKLTRKRTGSNVILLHDLQHTERAHPKVPKVDALVSVGGLGYIKHAKKVLTDFGKKVKKGGQVCFLDYDKFFDVIPNIEWIQDDKKVKKLFSDAGFKITIERKQGFAWTWIYICGKKK